MIMHVGLAGFDQEYNITPTSSSSTGGGTTQGSFLSFRTPGRGLSNIFRAQIGGETVTGASFACKVLQLTVHHKLSLKP
jgi:phosphate-selective porin OprO and OprP